MTASPRRWLTKCFAAVVLVLVASSPGACAPQPMLVLKQKHHLYGNVVVSIAPQSVRVDDLGLEMFILCSGPAWDVKFIRPALNEKHTIKFDSWSRNGIRTPISLEQNEKFSHFPVISTRAIVYAGSPCTEALYPDDWKHSYNMKKVQAIYAYCRKFPVHKNISAFLTALYDVPPVQDGLPFKFARNEADSGFGFRMAYQIHAVSVIQTLETSSIKNAVLAPELFKEPPKLKEVTDGQLFVPDPHALDEIIR
ncbi:MAG TPA: hypothetical protein V6C69_17700 [Trichormus sp.]